MTFPPDLPVRWAVPYSVAAQSDGERAGDLFIQPVGGTLHAVDIHGGSTRWTADYNAMIVAADADCTAIVPRRGTWGPHSMVGLSNRDGQVLWGRATGGSVAIVSRSNATRSGLLRIGNRHFLQVWRLPAQPGAWLWELDLTTGETVSRRAIPGALRPVCAAEGIFSARSDAPIVWWFDGQEEREIQLHSPAYHLSVAAGRLVTWHKHEREYRAWELPSGRHTGTFPGTENMPALDHELLVAPFGRELVAWDLATGQERWRITPGSSGAYTSSTFLGPYVANSVTLGHLLRRADGAVVIADEPMYAPRCFDDLVLWLRGNTLHRLGVTP